METTGSGLLSRVGERVLSWLALGALIALGVAIWQLAPETKAAIWSGIWRTGAWLAIAALVPWGVRPVIRRVANADTNWAGLGLLAVLLAVDLVAAAMLMTALPAGVWSWILALAALALVCTYNYLVAEYLAERFGG
ncbi:MAG: hypothetical protein AB7Q17_06320 [Phycisphaerae bacterium]